MFCYSRLERLGIK